MGNTWGISGPLFLLLFVCALIAPAVGWSAWKRSARGSDPQPVRPAGPYELAYLAGGRDRIIDTAVAALLERGQLRLSATTKKLSALAAGAQPTVPIESSVWTAVAGQPEYADVVYLRFRLRDDPAIAAVAESVVNEGLMVAPHRQRRGMQTLKWVYMAIFVVGFVRLCFGLASGHPVALLLTTLLLAGPVVAIGLAAGYGNIGTLHTQFGDSLLAQARGNQPQQHTDYVAIATAGAAAVVALGGLATYPDATIRAALVPLLGPTGGSSSSSSGNSCSTNTSSSCSSSSCSSNSGSGCGG